jgi:hypothetical protein
MQVPETDVTWTYSLLNASESRASARAGTPLQNAAELVGIDGTNNGGLQPFPGFREAYRFKMDTTTGWTSSNPYVPGSVSAAHRAKVVDFWSFSVIAGANRRVFGYVYVSRRPSVITSPVSCNNVYDIICEFYAPNGSTSPSWASVVVQEGIVAENASILADGGKAVMSMETTGRTIYLFRRGVAPVAIYFKATNSTTTDMVKNTSAGPGIRPNAVLFSGNFGPASTHSTSNFPDPTNPSNAPGSVVFCRNDAGAGNPNGTLPVNLSTAVELQEGTYSLAVQFEDSRSGRKSQICNNVNLTFVGSSVRLIVDGIYDSDRFDTLNIYRSVRTNASGGPVTGGILQLDAQVTLDPTYKVTSLPGVTTTSYGPAFRLFRYAYQLTDSSLVMQDVFLEKPSYSTTMPKGGAGALLDGTMLVGNISDSPTDLTGTGETRWSSSGVESPELFTATGIYKPANIGDAVTCFRRTGQIMAGFTRSGVQIFSKQNGFIKVLGAHQGYGVTGPYAACTVGPVTYFMNYRGLKALYPDGRLDDVQAINQVVTDSWYAETTGAQELSKISIAFDPATLCLYILNPAREQAVQMWFATGVVSELRDMSFAKVAQGWWEDTDGQLVPRALFLFNAPYPDAVTNINFRPAIYMPCRNYNDKQFTPSKPVVGMLDANINRAPTATLTINQPDPPTAVYQFDSSCTQVGVEYVDIAASTVSTDPTVNYRMIGMWVYALAPVSNPTSVVKARVIDATATDIRLTADILGTNLKLGIDPVYVKWMGAALRVTEGKDEDFVVRQPTSMGVVFSEYEAASQSPASKYWVGSLYRNEEETPLLSYVPTLPDGTVVTNSIQAGDTPHWVAFGKHSYLGQWFFPCFETFMPNVRYRLVGAQVKGRMLPTDRTRRTY